MPEALWDAAVALARVHGPGLVGRQLELDEAALARRLGGVEGRPVRGEVVAVRRAEKAPPFVDAGPVGALLAQAVGAGGGLQPVGQVEIELCRASGERLTLRVPATLLGEALRLVEEHRGRP
jgi:hypothetical protein